MSSKAIQDRIYRSRLTIRYRTNIDGVPVPQKLPLRLLVLGDFSGYSPGDGGVEAPPLPEEMRFENRQIVSIKHGAKIDKVMEEWEIAFPIPTGRGPMAPIADSARLSGAFDGKREEGLGATGAIVDTNDEGQCAVRGRVRYSAALHDNQALALSGLLEVMGRVEFDAAGVATGNKVTLSGTYALHAKGDGKLSAFGLEKDAEGSWSVQAIGQGSLWNDTQDREGADKDKPWISGDVGGKLRGALEPARGRDKAVFKVSGQESEIAFTKEIKYGIKISAGIPLVNDAPLLAEGGKASLTPQEGAKASFEVADADATPIAVSLLAGPLVGGMPSVMIKPSATVTVKTGDGKSFTGTPSGQLVAAAAADGDQDFSGKLTVTAAGGDEHEVDVTIKLAVASNKADPIPADTKVTPSGKVRHVITPDGAFDITIDDNQVVSSGGALSVVVSCPVRVRKAGGGVLTGVANGTLAGAASTYAVGDQDVTGSVTIESGTENLVLPVKARIRIAVSGEQWRIDDAATVTYDLDGQIPVAVAGEIPVGHLLEIASGKIPIGKRGVYAASFREGALITLKSAAGEPDFQAMGELTGKLECSLKQPIDSGLQRFAAPQAYLSGKFQHPDSGACELRGSVEITIPKPRVSLVVYGRLRGEGSEGLTAPGAVRPEDVRADVLAAVADGATPGFSSLVHIDAEGNVSVDLSGPCEARRTILVNGLNAFAPDNIAANVPEIRRLDIVRGLLQELKSQMNLMPSVRDAIIKLMRAAKDVYPVLREQLRERYPALAVGRALAEEPTPLTPKERDLGTVWFERTYSDYETAVARAAEIPGGPDANPRAALVMVPTSKDGEHTLPGLTFHDQDLEHTISDRGRLLNGLASLIINDPSLYRSTDIVGSIEALSARVGGLVQRYMGHILGDESFRRLERNWRGVAELCAQVESDEVVIDLLHVSAAELAADLSDHASDIFTSTLFKRIYVEEYDRYGGKPFGAMVGLYHFSSSDEDIALLTTMSEIANAAHCPFISSVAPKFFGDDMETWDDLKYIGDIEAHLNLPKFGKWNVLRDSGEAPYLGLTLPGYLIRKPWGAEESQLGNRQVRYDETAGGAESAYLWGNSGILFAKNMVRSFEQSGWCQYIRGVKGGGLVPGLTVHTIKRHDKEEAQSPVEFEIADYRELQFSKAGLIPLVHCKGSSDAAFFSSQSLKKPRDFRSEIDTQNAYLVTNLSYTLSITRIAHYVKRMMRDYIGSTADAAYIQNVLQLWLNDYITTTVNPDDLTLRYYPFKAVSVSVAPKVGPLGWYKAIISILPHVQFEGMDVELRLEAALGGK